MIKRVVIVCVSAVALQACAYLERVPAEPLSVSESSLLEAGASPRRISRIAQTNRALLDGLPVGSVIAYYPVETLRLPEGWAYADGSMVADPESPFNGRRVPQLNDDRYLIGSISSFGAVVGNNDIAPAGEHDHDRFVVTDRNSTTGPPNTNADSVMVTPGTQGVRIPIQGHQHFMGAQYIPVKPDGSHNHGGDNRPLSFGILYIVKIK
jgi:hypothetical protein